MSYPHEEWSTSLFCETTPRNDSASAEVCGRTGISTPSRLVGFCPVPSKAAAAAGESLAEEVHSLLQREREPTADELLHLPLAFGFQRGKLTPFLPACRSVGFSADHVISADGAATGPCEFDRGRQHGCRRVPKHEIEVERGDWSAVDGRGCVADQHGFQVVLFERAKNSAKEWGGVHDRKDTRRGAPRAKAADAKPDWSRW